MLLNIKLIKLVTDVPSFLNSLFPLALIRSTYYKKGLLSINIKMIYRYFNPFKSNRSKGIDPVRLFPSKILNHKVTILQGL